MLNVSTPLQKKTTDDSHFLHTLED